MSDRPGKFTVRKNPRRSSGPIGIHDPVPCVICFQKCRWTPEGHVCPTHGLKAREGS